MADSKNDVAWVQLFDKHKILETVNTEGSILINSNQINEFREARLMTKFDHKTQLPKLFADNNLSILPVSRGGYIIGAIETFHDFSKEDVDIEKINFPTFLESLDYQDITSEATAINCAFVSGILSDFTAEEKLYPTVSGRMSSNSFNFFINSAKGQFKVNVGNSQIEIDGGYEGANSLNLIEAKNYISNDFLVRQLYYPYKLWASKIRKKVRPIFLTYTNGIFHLREYGFDDINHYNSLRLINQKKYAVQEGAFNIESIQQIFHEVVVVSEPNIPFPQANSFERVINLCELLKEKDVLTKVDVTLNYDFDARQTDYYTNACKYLGLVEQKIENAQIIYVLTSKGKELFDISIISRQAEFVKLILSHVVFRRALELTFKDGKIPDIASIVPIMKHSNLFNVNSESTYFRRASTILGWINWIMNLIEE
jgi:hypothetical protein